jgi:predicted HTH transcriptional regulator
LRSRGLDVDVSIFQDNSRYFRNALVRANYTNLKKNIFEERVFLDNFFIDLVDGTHHEMKSRYLLVGTDGTLLIDQDLNTHILSLIDANPSITRAQMAEQLQVSVKTIERHLKELSDKVTRTGSRRKGAWKVEDSDSPDYYSASI